MTGSTPLDKSKLREAAYTEILRRIREEEPPTPSTRLSESKDTLPSVSAQRQSEPLKLTKLVRGELDWIVMKALEKDRTRRYETASSFARDIERYLAGDAVEAGPPSATYKLRKLAQAPRGAGDGRRHLRDCCYWPPRSAPTWRFGPTSLSAPPVPRRPPLARNAIEPSMPKPRPRNAC